MQYFITGLFVFSLSISNVLFAVSDLSAGSSDHLSTSSTFSGNNASLVTPKMPLRILTWDGYVTNAELNEVNTLLDELGYPYYAELLEPYAEGGEQMFDLIRGLKCDVTFLTLFFIKMENEQTSTLLQAINTDSPRLSHYRELRSNLKQISMGLNNKGLPLYIPWGGGAYGFYVDRKQVAKEDIPSSVKDLWLPKWKGQFSLNKSQPLYNLGLSLMSLDKSPFYLHELTSQQKRNEIVTMIEDSGALQSQLNKLYGNSAQLWTTAPLFNNRLKIISSWGPEIARENRNGGDWQKIEFGEGDMVWLDTINFVKDLTGKKLEAAEIFANYFISKKVQSRITNELSMVAASSKVEINPSFGDPEKLFNKEHFVPPYDAVSYSVMKRMTNKSTHAFEMNHE